MVNNFPKAPAREAQGELRIREGIHLHLSLQDVGMGAVCGEPGPGVQNPVHWEL